MSKEITKPVHITIARINRHQCKIQTTPEIRIRLITCRNCDNESLSARDYIYLSQVRSELFKLYPQCNQAIKACLQKFMYRVKNCLEKNKNLRGRPFADESEKQVYKEIVRDYFEIYCFHKNANKVPENSKKEIT